MEIFSQRIETFDRIAESFSWALSHSRVSVESLGEFATLLYLIKHDQLRKVNNSDCKEGNDLGLNKEEKAFYDALTQPEMVRKAYSDEQFVALTKELTDTLRKNRTIDWNKRESARAQMRTMVKRLLRKYNYPPEGQEQALEVVMEQCNQWADQEYYDAIAESGGRLIF